MVPTVGRISKPQKRWECLTGAPCDTRLTLNTLTKWFARWNGRRVRRLRLKNKPTWKAGFSLVTFFIQRTHTCPLSQAHFWFSSSLLWVKSYTYQVSRDFLCFKNSIRTMKSFTIPFCALQFLLEAANWPLARMDHRVKLTVSVVYDWYRSRAFAFRLHSSELVSFQAHCSVS